jgi:O-antigen/teichoic acid export membrane protein
MSEAKFHRAVTWAYLMNWGEKGFSALFTFVLASILGPGDFGVVAMAMIYILFIQMFLEQGLAAALIQRKDLRNEHLDTVFWANIGLSILLMSVGIACCRWWERMNHAPGLALFIAALSLALPIEGLSIVPRSILQREMDFKSLSIRSTVSVLIGGAVGLTMAFMGFKSWALVGQRLVTDSSAAALLWGLSHWRPRSRASFARLKELLGFSGANFLAKLSIFCNRYCGALLLGAFFGPVAVGLYRLAERLTGLVLDITTTSLQSVSLPHLSRVQDDAPQLRKNMIGLINMTSISVFPLMCGMAAVSTPVMKILGPKWLPASDVLKVLCAAGVVLAISQFIGPLLQAVSKPHYAAAIMWADAALSVGFLLAAALFLRHSESHRQVMGIAIIRLVADASFMIPCLLFVLRRFAGIRTKELLAMVYAPAMSGFAIIGAVALLHLSGISAKLPAVGELVLETLVGGIAALTTFYLLDRERASMVISMIRSKLPWVAAPAPIKQPSEQPTEQPVS